MHVYVYVYNNIWYLISQNLSINKLQEEVKKVRELLTHALEFLFELSLVLAIGDAEVVVRVSALVYTIGRSSSSNSHDCGRTLSPLKFAYFINSHHFFFLSLKEKLKAQHLLYLASCSGYDCILSCGCHNMLGRSVFIYRIFERKGGQLGITCLTNALAKLPTPTTTTNQ